MTTPEREALPITLEDLDHYTLIVADGKSVSDFHVDTLGFKFLRLQDVGTEPGADPTFAMRNYVLEVPGPGRRICVITEGLNEESLFTKYMRKYGPGIHHVAYSVKDIKAAVATLRQSGVCFTSEAILRDPTSGLRQIFIERKHPGYFLELIERTQAAEVGYFANVNMSRLVETMASYVRTGEQTADSSASEVVISCSADTVREFLRSPGNLPVWTCHRAVRKMGDHFVDVRLHGDVVIHTEENADGVLIHFSRGPQSRTFLFRVTAHSHDRCIVMPVLPSLPEDRRNRTERLIAAELRLLAAHLEGREPANIEAADKALIEAASIDVFSRKEL